jgi:hypothetical protein
MDRQDYSGFTLLGGWIGITLRVAALVVVGATLLPPLWSEILSILGLTRV